MSPPGRLALWIVVAIVGAAILGAILLWAIARNTSEGEPVGRVDLATPGATLPVALATGDVLHFRIDAVFGTPPGPSRERVLELDGKLRASTLTVRLTDAGGAVLETSCPVFFGAGRQGDITALSIEKSMVNECVLTTPRPGAAIVQPRVAWASGLAVRSASVEVRVERSAR